MDPRKHLEKSSDFCLNIFISKIKSTHCLPLEKGYCPKLEPLKFLDADSAQQCEPLIGTLQQEIHLGRIEMATTAMKILSCRVEPRTRLLERIKRMCECLHMCKHGSMQFRTKKPELSAASHAHAIRKSQCIE